MRRWMLLGLLVMATCAVTPERAAAQIPACTVSWARGGSGDWSQASNWSTGAVPGTADHVCITQAGEYTVTLQGSRTAATLQVSSGATLALLSQWGTDASLTVSGEVQNAGTVVLETLHPSYLSTLQAQRVTNSGLLAVRAGEGGGHRLLAELINQGTVLVGEKVRLDRANAQHANSGTLTVSNGSLTIVQSGTAGPSFTNRGRVTVADGTVIDVSGGRFVNAGDGALHTEGRLALSSTAMHFDGGVHTGGPVALSAGALHIGAGATGAARFRMTGTVSMTGSIAQSQSVTIASIAGANANVTADSFTNAGTLELTSDLSGSPVTLTLANSGTLVNTGTIHVRDAQRGELRLGGSLDNKGTLNLGAVTSFTAANSALSNSGTITVAAEKTLNLRAGGQTLNNSGTLAVEGSLSMSGGAVNLSGGAVTGNLNLESLTLTFSGGTITGGTAFLSGGTLNLNSPQGATASFTLSSTASLNGATSPAQTLVIQTASGSSVNVTATKNFTNAGRLVFESLVGSSVTFTGPRLTNTGTLVIGAGVDVTHTIRAELINRGNMIVQQRTILEKAEAQHVNSGSLSVAGGSLSVNQSGFVDPSFTNTGSVAVSPGARLTVTGARFDNSEAGSLAAHGDLEFTDTALYFNGGSHTGNPILMSHGGFHIGSGATGAARVRMRGTVALSGNIANDQTVTLFSWGGWGVGVTTSGSFTNAGTLELYSEQNSAARLTIANNGTITNTGTFNVDGKRAGEIAGSLINNGWLNLRQTLSFQTNDASLSNSGSVTIDPGHALDLTRGGHSVSQTAGTLAVGGSLNVKGVAFNLSGGTVSGNTLSLESVAFNFTGGDLVGAGVNLKNGTLNLNHPAAARFILRGSSTLKGAASAAQTVTLMTDEGQTTAITVPSGFATAGRLVLDSLSGYPVRMDVTGGTLTNSGTMHIQKGKGGDRVVVLSGADAAFVNGGTLRIDPDQTFLVEQRTFSNLATGSIVGRGTLQLNGTAFTSGGTLEPSVYNNGGKVSPEGLLSIQGTYTQTSGGTLEVDLGPSMVERLVVMGSASLNGALTANVSAGFVPAQCGRYPVLTSAYRSGTFSVAPAVALADQWNLRANYDSTDAALLAVNAGTLVNVGPTALQLNEGTRSAEYRLCLSSQPPSDVAVAIVPGNQLAVSAATAVMTRSAWEQPATIAVRALADGVAEGTHSATISHSHAGGGPVASVSVTITESNLAAPTAREVAVLTSGPAAIVLEATDPDAGPLTFSILSEPLHGTLGALAGNQVTYTPASGYTGPDSFTFQASDGLYISNAGTVWITVGEQAPACTVTWVRAGSGTWSDTAGWSTGSLPGPADHVCFSASDSRIVLSDTRSVASLRIGPGVTLVFAGVYQSPAVLTATGDVLNEGVISFENTRWDTSGTLTARRLINTGVLAMRRADGGEYFIKAELANRGQLSVERKTTLEKPGAQHVSTGVLSVLHDALLLKLAGASPSAFANSGSLKVAQGTSLTAEGGSFANTAGGTLLTDGTFSLTGTALTFGGGVHTGLKPTTLNGGALRIGPGATGAAHFQLWDSVAMSGDIAPEQTVTLVSDWQRNATVTAAASFTNAGTLEITAVHYSTNSVLTFADSGTVTNIGTFNVNRGAGGSRTLAGSLENWGMLLIHESLSLTAANSVLTNRGNLLIAPEKALDLKAGGQTLNQADGTLSVGGSLNMTGGTFHLSGGTLGGNSINLESLTVNVTGGQMTGQTAYLKNGTLNLNNPQGQAASFTLRGASTLNGATAPAQAVTLQAEWPLAARASASNGFTNAGSLTLESTHYSYGAILVAPRLTNTGRVTVRDLSQGDHQIRAELVNHGSVVLERPTVLERDGSAHVNAGTLELAGGSLTLNLEGIEESSTFASSGAVNTAPGTSIAVNGGSFTNAAGSTLSVGGTLQLANTTLRFDGGAHSGTPMLISGGALHIGSGATGAAKFVLMDTVAMSGDIAAGQSVTLSADWNRTASVNAAAGFTNAGVFEMVSSHYSNPAVLTIGGNGTLTNLGTMNVNVKNGGDRFLGGNLDNRGTLNLNQSLSLTRQGSSLSNSGTVVIAHGKELSLKAGGQALHQTAGTLSIGGSLGMTGGTANLSGGSVHGNSLNLAGLTLNFTGGDLAVRTMVLQDGALNLSNPGPAAVFVLKGASTLSGGTGPAQTVILEAEYQQNAAVAIPNGFVNAGLLALESTHYSNGAVLSGSQLTNTGTLHVRNRAGGSHQIKAELVNRGAFVVELPTTLERTDAMHVNSGTLTLAGGTLTINQSGSAAPTFTNGGLVTIPLGMELRVNGGRWANVAGGSLMVRGALRLSNAALEFSGGTHVGSRLTVSGGALHIGTPEPARFMLYGTVSLSGSIAAGQNVMVSADSGLHARVTAPDGFTNAGTLTLTSNSSSYGTTLTIADSGTLTNTGAIQIVAGGDRSFAGSLDNRGTLRIDPGRTLAVSGGTVSQSPSAVVAGTGTLRLNGATLTGGGSMEPSLYNSGTVRPDGQLWVQGTYTQTSTAALEIDIGTAGMDRLAVGGSATLAGTLTVRAAAGFLPAGGCSLYPVITASSRSGTFGSAPTVSLGNLWNLRTHYATAEVALLGYNTGSPVNVGPTALQMMEGAEGTPYRLCLSEQPAADLTVTINSGTQLTVSPTTATFSRSAWDKVVTVTVTALADGVPEGQHTGTVTHVSSDGSAVAPVTVSITEGNVTAPVAQDVQVQAKGQVTITLPAADADGDTLTYTIVTGPAHGTLGAVDGKKVTYTPVLGYLGTDSFTFKASDGKFESNVATVSLTVDYPYRVSGMAAAERLGPPYTLTVTWYSSDGSVLGSRQVAPGGTYTAEVRGPGTYYLRASRPGWLTVDAQVTVAEGVAVTEGPALSLVFGDLNSDRKVDNADLALYWASYRRAPAYPEWDLGGRPEVVDLLDLSVLARRMGSKSPALVPSQ